MLMVLALICSLVSLVCWIMVLIKMFQTSILYGILGIICPLWALIWGFMNMKEKGIEKVMMIWAVAIVINVVLNVMLRGQMGAVTG